MSEWQPIDTAPVDGRNVLACFKGQFSWVKFIAVAAPVTHGGVYAQGYAKPTHWMPLTDDPK